MASLKDMLAAQGLLLATHNQGKLKEIQTLLAPLNINCLLASDKNLPEPEENGDSFVANAMIKSIAAAKATGMPSLSDDSGLAVPALGGSPGIYSARWAGPNKDFTVASARIKTELAQAGCPLNSPAYFVCVLSLALPGVAALDIPNIQNDLFNITTATQDELFCINIEGRINGHLTFPARGDQGFGYDPIFIANGMAETFAEITPAKKQAISHRANAFKGLVSLIN